ATSRVEQVIHQPYQTLGASMSTFTGQNFGAGKYDRVKEGLRKGINILIGFSLLMLPLMQFGGRAIVGLFVEDASVIEMGAKALRISSYFYAALGMIYVVRGVLTGVGDGVFALQNGIVEVIGRFIFPVALTMIPALGVWGIWWSVAATWVISAITAFIRYRHYGKRIGIIEP
ncbi:MAG: MATE family efflux transporter, partial [Lachnospiraceae bacterium]|nr:MATE family efflux transporter [Lachnospiraceae bacterium]